MKEFQTIEQNFKVSYSYNLYTTEHLFEKDNPVFVNLFKNIQGASKVLFVIDSQVAEKHSSLVRQITTYCANFSEKILLKTSPLILEGGEQIKNNSTHVEYVLNAIEGSNICRHSYVAVIGGGALIDMVGYAAAIAHRGVRLIRIPTTVLSQNDSAVGVKNSINFFGKKNFLGTFAPPFAIINDKAFLRTLEKRDWISGISEAVKVALIKDAQFYSFIKENAELLKNRDEDAMQYLIYRCAALHMEHISSGDPFESGSSRPLDFGHWSAHKLEQMTHYELRHGEAVAKGIALDVTYSFLIKKISENTLDDILTVMLAIGFDLNFPEDEEQINEMLLGIEEFREHLGGKLTITLIDEIGKKTDVHAIDFSIMKQAVQLLKTKLNK